MDLFLGKTVYKICNIEVDDIDFKYSFVQETSYLPCYKDLIGKSIFLTKEEANIKLKNMEEAYQMGRNDAVEECDDIARELSQIKSGCSKWLDEHDRKIRNDAIEGCLEIIEKIMPTEPFLKNSKHYENWKMKTTELRMLRNMLEQIKGETE